MHRRIPSERKLNMVGDKLFMFSLLLLCIDRLCCVNSNLYCMYVTSFYYYTQFTEVGLKGDGKRVTMFPTMCFYIESSCKIFTKSFELRCGNN